MQYFIKFTVYKIILSFIFILIASFAYSADSTVKIGVLAKRGYEHCLEKWSPTAVYLTKNIIGKTFVIVPIKHDRIYTVVENGEVDFILANSSFYVELESWLKVSRIATLKNMVLGGIHTTFGGVIFCKKQREDIRQLIDLKGKTFMAVEETSFGGWRMAWRELKVAGIDPFKNFASLSFGETHDAVVYAVRNGKVDSGTVRTDTLERMEAEGKICLGDFYVINEHSGGNLNLPSMHSTREYPEWPVAKLKHTSNELAEKVAVALIELPAGSAAANAARCAGWTIPLNYQPVHECLKELKLGPYKDLGKITVSAVVKKYWIFILTVAVLFASVLGASIFIFILNRNIKKAQMEMQAEVEERKHAQKTMMEMEIQLQQAQKMEAIGALAGGIAHDFNNILFPISGYTEMLLYDIPDDSPLHHNLSKISAGVSRAGDLVSQILTFSRKKKHELKPLKVELLIKEVINLIRSSLPTTIKIRQNINKDCGLVMADPTQVHQVVMNLCTNAFHAMEETGGDLTITLKKVELAAEDLKNPAIIPGTHVCLTVADTGPGIEQNIIDRIFDPYFTTKKEGKGTGLGLAVVDGIVRSHGGQISVYSESGNGTEFNVYLPVIKEQKETAKIETDAPIQKGNERILLVDDEDIIAQMEKEILERLGYHVTARTSSTDTLKIFRAQPDKFDLVITDLTMPDMTGDKLAKKLMAIRPDIPIILCTGFSEKMSEEKAKALGIKGFMMKPVVISDLVKTICEVLAKNQKGDKNGKHPDNR